MNRYITIYRGDVTTGKEFTEVGFRPKESPYLNHRWYLNPTDSSLNRVSNLITRREPKLFNAEVLQESVYLTLKFEDNPIR
jgi:hypothetical protein